MSVFLQTVFELSIETFKRLNVNSSVMSWLFQLLANQPPYYLLTFNVKCRFYTKRRVSVLNMWLSASLPGWGCLLGHTGHLFWSQFSLGGKQTSRPPCWTEALTMKTEHMTVTRDRQMLCLLISGHVEAAHTKRHYNRITSFIQSVIITCIILLCVLNVRQCHLQTQHARAISASRGSTEITNRKKI